MLLVLGIAYVLTNLISHCYVLLPGCRAKRFEVYLKSIRNVGEKSEGQLIW